MSQDWLAPVVAVIVFVCGMGGLAYHAWSPPSEQLTETRDLLNRLTGLVGTLSALVLGLLIASSNSFYNAQKTGLETVSARVLELDGVLRRYGPEAQPAREMLKELTTASYERVWQDGNPNLTMPSVEQSVARMDGLFQALNALREQAPEGRRFLIVKAADLAGSINDQRLQISLQLSSSLSWPFMTIMVCWVSLLFFAFGLLAQWNMTSVIGLGVGAMSVASAIFLIVELSTPYSGMLRLSPDPVLQTIAVLAK
jgi:hypothetical protein